MTLLDPAGPVDEPGYADRYDPDTHFDRWYTDATADVIAPTVRNGDRLLELGCATGRMTAAFCERGADVVGLDHSAHYLSRARDRCPDAELVQTDIEAWLRDTATDHDGFDHIVAANVVHELRSLHDVFAACRRLIHSDGALHVTLQNPHSVHRLTGRALGVITHLAEVTPTGRDLLTLEIHDADQLTHALTRAGFVVVARQGIMLKPFPNAEMERLTENQLRGLIAVARDFPDHSAMNHLVARPA